MIQELTYEQARPLIKSGDIINVFRGKSGWLRTIIQATIQFFSGSPIFHTVVACWMTSPSGIQRLMCIETSPNGGKRITPLSIYTSIYDTEVIPLPAAFSFNTMEEEAMVRVGIQPYGYLDLFIIGAHEFFGTKKVASHQQVCSELVADLWVTAGVPLLDQQVSPGRLRNELGALGYVPTIKIAKQR